MLFIYSLGLTIYGFVLRIASYLSPKAKLMVDGRAQTFNIITEEQRKHPNARWIWIHAASLGEFEQGRYLIERLKSDYTQYRIALSFYSPSGYEPRKNYEKADMVFYLPLDTSGKASSFIELLSPELAIFIKYDFWWNHLNALQKGNIPTVFVSSMFRSDQYFVKNRLGRIRRVLMDINHFYVQNEESKIVLEQMGINQSTISGDSRLDSVMNEVKPSLEIYEQVKRWKSNKKCIIYGSVHISDIEVIRSMLAIEACHLIVPHDVDKANLSSFKDSFNESELYSVSGFSQGSQVILDKIGVLRYLYEYGDLVYVGGGFGKGIHNILEPLVHLKPILIGPAYTKFPEANELLFKDAIMTIDSPNQAQNAAKDALERYNDLKEQSQRQYIRDNSGATEIILQSLQQNRWI